MAGRHELVAAPKLAAIVDLVHRQSARYARRPSTSPPWGSG
jgi:hypothetical protein